MRTYSQTTDVPATPTEVFSFVDDHALFSSHMNERSWMMGGGRMDVSADEGRGRRIGSHIRLSGKAFGVSLFVDEVVTEYQPPRLKSWETVGSPRLLIVGRYRMSVHIEAQAKGSRVAVSIAYDLPNRVPWLGRLAGPMYAKWCVREMVKGVRARFAAGLR